MFLSCRDFIAFFEIMNIVSSGTSKRQTPSDKRCEEVEERGVSNKQQAVKQQRKGKLFHIANTYKRN
jgi:hypothetical protein